MYSFGDNFQDDEKTKQNKIIQKWNKKPPSILVRQGSTIGKISAFVSFTLLMLFNLYILI